MKSLRNLIGLALIISLGASIQSCKTKVEETTEKEACCSSDKKELAEEKSCCDTKLEEAKVQVYYFHATRRCATCEAVEKVSKEYIQENYKSGVSFISINREKDENEDLVNKYEIAGQTLLVIIDDEVVNLTTKAFLNARNNPEKLEDLLKSTIDSKLI